MLEIVAGGGGNRFLRGANMENFLAVLIFLGIAHAVGEGLCALISKVRGTDAVTKSWQMALYLSAYSLAILGVLIFFTSDDPSSWRLILYFAGMFISFFSLLSIVPRVTDFFFKRLSSGLRGVITTVLFLASYFGAVCLLGKFISKGM